MNSAPASLRIMSQSDAESRESEADPEPIASKIVPLAGFSSPSESNLTSENHDALVESRPITTIVEVTERDEEVAIIKEKQITPRRLLADLSAPFASSKSSSSVHRS